jgi:hypothetical protein
MPQNVFFIKRRGYVIPEDVRAVVHDVLRTGSELRRSRKHHLLTSSIKL